MFEIIKFIKESELVVEYDLLEYIDEDSIKLVKIKAKFVNESVLYITEVETDDHEKYSYHWQSKDGNLIIRWDNSPHHDDLETFPYHKHVSKKVFPSHRVTIQEILEEIKDILSTNYTN
jgi:hypothetical protein